MPPTSSEWIRSKIHYSKEEILPFVTEWRLNKKRLVFTNGCFDILHRGHVDYLAQASLLGDVLIVGLNSDDSVKRLKGPDRPLQDQLGRALVLASLQCIDKVVLFHEDTPFEIISCIVPDILVKGGDYLPKNIVGYDIVTQAGGTVITIDITQGYSTTSIINRLKI